MADNKQTNRNISQKGTLATDGIKLSGLLESALGKKLPQITDDDIRSLAAKNGFSKQETNKILKGWGNSKGNELLLNESGTRFNTKEGDYIADKSSKSTGNKAGFQISDIVGKGNRVNDLGRLGAALLKNKPVETTPSKTGSTEATTTTTPVDTKPATETSTGTTGTTTAKKIATGGGSGTGGSGVKPITYVPPTTTKQTDDSDLLLGDQSQVGKYVPPFGQLQGGFQLQQGLKAKGTKDNYQMPGYLKTLNEAAPSWMTYWPEAPKDVLNKIHNSNWAAEKRGQSDLQNAIDVFTPALTLYGLGGLGKAALKGVKGGVNALRSKFAKMPSTSTNAVNNTVGNVVNNTGTLYGPKPIPVSHQASKGAFKFPTYTPKTTQTTQATEVGSKFLEKVKPVQNVRWSQQGQDVFDKMTPEQRARAVEAIKKFPPIMNTGGKLPMASNGRLLSKNVSDLSKMVPMPQMVKFTGSSPMLDQAKSQFQFGNYDLKGELAKNTSASSIEPTGDGERNRKIGDGNGLEKVFTAAEQHGPDLIKYALPFIGAGAANKYYKQAGQPVKYEPANIMTGTVQSMQRPNFGQPYRGPVGNDLLSNTVGQKVGAGMQRAGEAAFEMQNSASKIGQKNMIVDRYNQGEMYNSQMKNRTNLFNAQRSTQSKFAQAQNVQEPLIAAQHMLAGDRATAGYLKADRMTEWAKNALKYSSDATARAAADVYLRTGKLPAGYKGSNSQWTQPGN